jgi:hypothetical protein
MTPPPPFHKPASGFFGKGPAVRRDFLGDPERAIREIQRVADRLKKIVYWTPVALAAAVRKHPEFRTHVELKELRQMAAAQMEEFDANVEKAIADLLRNCLPEDAAQS